MTGMHGETGFPEEAEDVLPEFRQWSLEQRVAFSSETIHCLRQYYSWARVPSDTASV